MDTGEDVPAVRQFIGHRHLSHLTPQVGSKYKLGLTDRINLGLDVVPIS